jgi:hypothetical protein
LAYYTNPGWRLLLLLLWSRRWNYWQGKPKYSENPAPVLLCPPLIPHDLTWARNRAVVVRSRRLTASAMERSKLIHLTRSRLPRLCNTEWQNNAWMVHWKWYKAKRQQYHSRYVFCGLEQLWKYDSRIPDSYLSPEYQWGQTTRQNDHDDGGGDTERRTAHKRQWHVLFLCNTPLNV